MKKNPQKVYPSSAATAVTVLPCRVCGRIPLSYESVFYQENGSTIRKEKVVVLTFFCGTGDEWHRIEANSTTSWRQAASRWNKINGSK